MGVSKNRGTPKLSIFIGFSIITHPFWGALIFGNTHIFLEYFENLIFSLNHLMTADVGRKTARPPPFPEVKQNPKVGAWNRCRRFFFGLPPRSLTVRP